ncbi:MAG TPA: peptide chain release factor N(5)-glutamine methyltransferase [Blastocatellia bacterium]|nr:peptide chain release factor N(5)-glutamine methyltransferase [Blastocatellia bacterium]
MPTIAEAIAEGARLLAESRVDEARRTATVLLGCALSVDRTYLLTRSDQQVDDDRFQSFIEMVKRRAAGEPLQYITGHQEFYGIDFLVTPDVLIPRPETELLVECVIKLAKSIHSPLVVDVGTGSGCIAVTLASQIQSARLIATDISRAALAVASLNAARHNLEARIEFLEGDMLAPLAGRGLEGAADFIASNPPYIPTRDSHLLQRELDWEPREALFGGPEGLDSYARLLADGHGYVKPGGYLVCEIGYTQLDRIREMIDAAVWGDVIVKDDLQGIPRTLAIKKR